MMFEVIFDSNVSSGARLSLAKRKQDCIELGISTPSYPTVFATLSMEEAVKIGGLLVGSIQVYPDDAERRLQAFVKAREIMSDDANIIDITQVAHFIYGT